MAELDIERARFGIEIVDSYEYLDFVFARKAVPVIDRGDANIAAGFSNGMECDMRFTKIHVSDRIESAVRYYVYLRSLASRNKRCRQIYGIAHIGSGRVGFQPIDRSRQ